MGYIQDKSKYTNDYFKIHSWLTLKEFIQKHITNSATGWVDWNHIRQSQFFVTMPDGSTKLATISPCGFQWNKAYVAYISKSGGSSLVALNIEVEGKYYYIGSTGVGGNTDTWTSFPADGLVYIKEHLNGNDDMHPTGSRSYITPLVSRQFDYNFKHVVGMVESGKVISLYINQFDTNNGYDKPTGYADTITVHGQVLRLTRQVRWTVTRMNTYNGFNRWLVGSATGNMGATGSSWFPASGHLGTNTDCGGVTGGGSPISGQTAHYEWHNFYVGTHTNASWFDDALAQNIVKYGFATTMGLHYMGSIFNNVTMAMQFSSLAFRWVYQ